MYVQAIASVCQRSSLIAVPQPMIIPGARFRETYYWDALWILKGLLACEMFKSATCLLQNFFDLLEEYGFVPNGCRV
jgi:alpha,alpha-trehalase